jgi:6-phosphofructo-2-kinase/fructose-2,6-biphosphatase 4
MINAGDTIIVNNCNFGYLPNRISFYLMNLHIKPRKTYFARAGVSENEESYKTDAGLSPEGLEYSKRLTGALIEHRKQEAQQFIKQGGSDTELKTLVVWISTRKRTVQTAGALSERNIVVKQKTQLSQINPGDVEGLTKEKIQEAFRNDWDRHQADPYHHRYPRGEVDSFFVYIIMGS